MITAIVRQITMNINFCEQNTTLSSLDERRLGSVAGRGAGGTRGWRSCLEVGGGCRGRCLSRPPRGQGGTRSSGGGGEHEDEEQEANARTMELGLARLLH